MRYKVFVLDDERTWLKIVRHSINEQEIITWNKSLNASSDELILSYRQPSWSVSNHITLNDCAELNEGLGWISESVKNPQYFRRSGLFTKLNLWTDSLSRKYYGRNFSDLKKDRYPELAVYDIITRIFRLVDKHKVVWTI